MTLSRRVCFSALIAAMMILGISGCAEENAIGPIVNKAGLTYMSPEIPKGEEGIGILYRRIMDFERFLADADKPVLVLVSSYTEPLDQTATLLLEQLAYEYRERTVCVRVEAEEYPDIAAFCGAGTLPCFAVIEKGALRNTTGGLVVINRETILALIEGAA